MQNVESLDLVSFDDLPGLAYPFLIVGLFCEVAWRVFRRKQAYPWRDGLVSLATYLMCVPTGLLDIAFRLPVIGFLWTERLATVPATVWWGIIITFLATEFCYYWAHRLSHEIRWLWASHCVHHSPETISLSTSFRSGATDFFSGFWLIYCPLFIIGFNPLLVGVIIASINFYQFWIHTEVIDQLGPFEKIFSTPSNHRVHHAINASYLDRNYGGILIIFDKIFGTFAAEERGVVLKYGIVGRKYTYNPIRLTFQEWTDMARDFKTAAAWRVRFLTLFGRPGVDYNTSRLGQTPPSTVEKQQVTVPTDM